MKQTKRFKKGYKEFKNRKDLNGYHLLLITGTFVSIYLAMILNGKYGIHGAISGIPIVLWVGGYELSKKLNLGGKR